MSSRHTVKRVFHELDDQLWKAGRTIDNCKWVSKKPEERCDVVSTYDGTKAKDLCRASCGTCGDAPAPGYKPTKKPSSGGAQYVPTYKPTRRPSGECEDDETWEEEEFGGWRRA